MINKKLLEYGRQKGWYRTNDQIFGRYEGHLYSVRTTAWLESPKQTIVTCGFGTIGEEQKKKLAAFLEKNKKLIGYKEYDLGSYFLVIYFHNTWRSTKIETLDQLLVLLSAELNNLNVKVGDNIENYDVNQFNYYDHNGTGVMLLPDEYNSIKQTLTQYNQQHSLQHSNYLPGIGGALLFTLPVVILWVLCAIYLNIITSIGGILIALVAYFGYEKLKGKEDVWMKVILTFITLLAIVVANIATIHFQLAEFGVRLPETLSLIQNDPEIKSVFYEDLGISLLFGAAGVFWIIFGISTESEYIKEAEKII